MPTSTNGTNGGTAMLKRNGFAKLLPLAAETRAKTGERPVEPPAAPSSPAAKPSKLPKAAKLSAAEQVERDLADAQLQVHKDRSMVELQADTARLDKLSPGERKAERKQAEKLRAAERKLQLLQKSTDVSQRTSAFKAEAKMAGDAQSEQVWQARAKARRVRLMDPTSRLATIYRSQLATSTVLMLLAAIGIVWCSVTVGQSLGGGLSYTIEPLFSVPLLVIMALHALAAQNRTTFLEDIQAWKVRAVEIALFAITIGLQVSAVLPKLASAGANSATLLITHLFPPALIVLAVTLQPMASAFMSRLLTTVYIEAGVDTKRLGSDEVNLLQRVKTINTLWVAGQLRSANPEDPADKSAGPSVKAVQDVLGIRKEAVQAGVDGWWQMYGPAETHRP
ncbi:hypothetical protein [Amycolatopsis sp. NBC_01480]|uniref:hypothetical protein n=1 Tax=Amycolatopsis sp. NBC_01480 TaxID=2903562 RepID=UPI002E2B1A17|nr:hypothetical protein [Amycolatopsis sp. NBC_01480]